MIIQMMIFSNEHQHSKILCPSSYHISTQWKSTLMTNVTSCVSRCEDAEWETTGPCLIIAGHSQGGAIAKVASLDLSTITERYEVITFGEPDALRQNSDECFQAEKQKCCKTCIHFRNIVLR